MFSSKSLIISGLTFISLIHFEFFFGYGVLVSFFTRSCPVFPALLIEEAVLSLLYILPSFVAIQCPQVHGFISGLSAYPVVLYFCFCAGVMPS